MQKNYDHRPSLDQARALKCEGKLKDARDILQKSLADVGDVTGSGRNRIAHVELLEELADVRAREGAFDAAFNFLSEGQEVLRSETDGAVERRLLERQAWVRFRQGKHSDARRIAEELLKYLDARELEEPKTFANLCNTFAGLCWQEGKLDEAVPYAERSLRLYEAAHDRFGAANALNNLGVLYFSRGEWAKAEESFEKSEKLRNDVGWMTSRSTNLINLGYLRMFRGDHAAARTYFVRGLTLAAVCGEQYEAAHAEIGLAQLELVEGRLDDAVSYLDSAMNRKESIGDDQMIQAYWLKGMVEAERGKVEEGIRLATEGRRLARESHLRESEADCCRALGVLQMRRKNYAEAEKCLRESVDFCQSLSDPYRRGLAMAELGMFYYDGARSNEWMRDAWTSKGLDNLEQAGQVFERLGATYDLKRVQTARSSVSH